MITSISPAENRVLSSSARGAQVPENSTRKHVDSDLMLRISSLSQTLRICNYLLIGSTGALFAFYGLQAKSWRVLIHPRLLFQRFPLPTHLLLSLLLLSSTGSLTLWIIRRPLPLSKKQQAFLTSPLPHQNQENERFYTPTSTPPHLISFGNNLPALSAQELAQLLETVAREQNPLSTDEDQPEDLGAPPSYEIQDVKEIFDMRTRFSIHRGLDLSYSLFKGQKETAMLHLLHAIDDRLYQEAQSKNQKNRKVASFLLKYNFLLDSFAVHHKKGDLKKDQFKKIENAIEKICQNELLIQTINDKYYFKEDELEKQIRILKDLNVDIQFDEILAELDVLF